MWRRLVSGAGGSGMFPGQGEGIQLPETCEVTLGPHEALTEQGKEKGKGTGKGANRVTTAKYSVVSFVPKFLLEQFMRLANFYFLVISLIQMSSAELAPTGQYYTFVPLMIILALTAIKELIEDLRRHRQDSEVNNKKAVLVRSRSSSSRSSSRTPAAHGNAEVAWKDLQVGDMVLVNNRDPFPADLILLASSGNDVTCYVETSGLDGETNLKLKQGQMNTPLTLSPPLSLSPSLPPPLPPSLHLPLSLSLSPLLSLSHSYFLLPHLSFFLSFF